MIGAIYLPWLLCAAALATGLDLVKGLLFTIHSPFGFLLLRISFPWALVVAWLLARHAKRSGFPRHVEGVLVAVALYPLAAWPFSVLLRRALSPPFTDTAIDYYLLLVSPVGRLFARILHAVSQGA